VQVRGGRCEVELEVWNGIDRSHSLSRVERVFSDLFDRVQGASHVGALLSLAVKGEFKLDVWREEIISFLCVIHTVL
jgi:hypothetical protein